MAFTVEDGTIVDDSNSFCSVEFADEYFSERSITAWTGDTSDKESALIRATDYIEFRFAESFLGSKVESDQSLSFPRTDIDDVDEDQVPRALKRATAEYALRALSAELAPDPIATDTGRVGLVSESHKTGPIEDTYRYASRGAGLPPPPFRPYPAADALLNLLLRRSSGVLR